MSRLLQRLTTSYKSRLSRKIGFWLFSSILTIEFILLIPSILRREREFMAQISEVSAGKISVLMQLTKPDATGRDILVRLEKLPNKPVDLIGKLQHVIVGGALYEENGRLVGTFGKPPKLDFKAIATRELSKRHGNFYDATWTPQDMNREYYLVFNHDISSVRIELTAFAIRIAGLVLIISSFATIVVWAALDIIAIEPVLALRQDLIKAGEAICRDRAAPSFNSALIKRTDELGDVIAAFDKMFAQISTATQQRKQAQAALKISLDKTKAYSKALDSELEKGRTMQLNFLPNDAQIQQLTQKYGWSIASFFQPARQVAGDFYDVFELGEGYLGVVIADVCDKGVGAALFMALFRSLIRIYSRQIQEREHQAIDLTHHEALEAISLTNNYIARYHGELGMFATIFFGIIEPSTGSLTYINGGHEPVVIIDSAGGVKKILDSTAPAVGMLPNRTFNLAQIYLQPGELLFAYTDGIPEARAKDGKFYTQKRLLEVLDRAIPSATILLDTIAREIQQHVRQANQFDDITLLVLQRKN